MQDQLNDLPKRAKDKHIGAQNFPNKAKKKPPKQLDYLMQELHEEEFQSTDCLECANCCKTTGPLFTPKDIERISKSFEMKPSKFIADYLKK